jgi:hypothetical protein
MTRFTKFILITIFGIIVLFFVFGFCLLDLNPINWDIFGRVLYVIISFFISWITYMCLYWN